jgi:hypothetical protein
MYCKRFFTRSAVWIKPVRLYCACATPDEERNFIPFYFIFIIRFFFFILQTCLFDARISPLLLVFRILGLCIVGFPREQITAAEFSAAQCLIHQWEGSVLRAVRFRLVSDLRCHSSCVDAVKQQAKRTRQSLTFFVLSISPSTLRVQVKKKAHFTVGIPPLKLCESLTALHTNVVVKFPSKERKNKNVLTLSGILPKWSCRGISNIRMDFFSPYFD